MNSPYFNTNAQQIEVSNKDFLGAVFQNRNEEEVVWIAGFANWDDEQWGGHRCKVETVPAMRERNAYFSVAAFNRSAKSRTKPTLSSIHCLVLDDATEVPDLEPTWILQTSRNSRQIGYRLSVPLTDYVAYDKVLGKLKGLASVDKSGNGAVRYMRLPEGMNNKPKYGEVYQCHLTHWKPDRAYTLQDLEKALVRHSDAPQTDSDGVVAPVDDAFANQERGDGYGDLIATILSAGEGLHQAIIQIAWRRVKDGVNPGAIKEELVSYMNQVPVHMRDERWKARFKEIDRAINSAVVKVREMHGEEIEPTMIAKPFDVSSPIPRREFIEINGQKVYSRGFMTLTGAAGGTGKSSLSIVEELSIVLGVDLFHPERKPLRGGAMTVWSMSLEDDEAEHRRRVWAAMCHYNIKPADLGDRYIVTYKADSPVRVVAAAGHGQIIVTPQVEQIKSIIREHNVAVLVADPFINTHEASENDNVQMNRVADAWRSIGQETGCAIGLTHHMRKSGGLNEASAEDLRGAVSLTAAARIVRVLSNPTVEEATSVLQIDPERRRFYFWVNPSGKPNIAPPVTSRVWYEMKGVELMNGDDGEPGDNVGVATSFELPDAMDGVKASHVDELARTLTGVSDDFLVAHCRKDVQAKGSWIGFLIGDIVGLDPDDESDQIKIKKIAMEWVRCGVLEAVKIKGKDRRDRPCLRLGKAAKTVDFDL